MEQKIQCITIGNKMFNFGLEYVKAKQPGAESYS